MPDEDLMPCSRCGGMAKPHQRWVAPGEPDAMICTACAGLEGITLAELTAFEERHKMMSLPLEATERQRTPVEIRYFLCKAERNALLVAAKRLLENADKIGSRYVKDLKNYPSQKQGIDEWRDEEMAEALRAFRAAVEEV